ncbi:uncharacterized protein N7482_003298 [Penicillium canariense]|uniref:Uncharacterized protein n=1 Tax=Penicillium canariense TaxID=189055 RepID=A0A9W9I6S0_9EURO|nr:uncharacterized protein N7482_003298 [Penicillium canariense]KAJ5167704.1 hypothetical protein N7482_003298 [Penicillium canariense]
MKVDLERVIAAMLAAQPNMRLNYGEIAKMYGGNANYNSMEHRFRAWRKMAENLRVTAGAGTPQQNPQTHARPPRTPRTPRTPKIRKSGLEQPSPASKNYTPKVTNPKVSEEPSMIIEVSSDDMTPIKPKIKADNEFSRSLMGIKRHHLEESVDDEYGDDEGEGTPEQIPKRAKREAFLVDAAQLPAFDLERDLIFDSQTNGYDLFLPSVSMTDAEAYRAGAASLDSLMRTAGVDTADNEA